MSHVNIWRRVAALYYRSQCEVFLVLNKSDLVHPRHRLLKTTDEIMDRAQEIMDRIDNEREKEAAAANASDPSQSGDGAKAGDDDGTGGGSGDSSGSSSSRSSVSLGGRQPLLFRDGGKTVDDHVTVFMISAKTGDGVRDVVDFLEHRARPGTWLFGRDETTNKDKRSRVQEIVREGLYKHLYKELPYQITTHTRYTYS